MEQNIDLKKLEKSTAAVIFQTGALDIMIGLIFLITALAMYYDDIRYYIDILYILPPIFFLIVKKYIIDPRMGVVEFSKRRVKKSMMMMISITLFLVIMVSLIFFGSSNTIGEIMNPRWIITGIIFTICVLVAYFLEFYRMYLYAFVLSGAFNLSEELREHPEIVSNNGIAYIIASIILIVTGLYYLTNFLKKYPLIKDHF